MAVSTITKETSGLENALVQYGTVAASSFTDGKYTLTFPKAFKTDTDPVVVATVNAAAATSVTAVCTSGLSETQVVFQITRAASGGTISTQSFIVRWIAIGERP